MKLGDIVRLRKAHPCGGYEWEVVRIGAHIGIKCLKCQRKVLLEKGVLQRRLEDVVGRNVVRCFSSRTRRPEDSRRK